MFYTVIDPQNPLVTKEIIQAPKFEHKNFLIVEYNDKVLSLIDGKLVSFNCCPCFSSQ